MEIVIVLGVILALMVGLGTFWIYNLVKSKDENIMTNETYLVETNEESSDKIPVVKVKDLYKSIVRIFLKTNEDITYWESQKIMSELSSLFPKIDFEKLRNEVREELSNQFESELNDKVVVMKELCDNPILGYRYGNPPKLHDSLPDYDEEIVVVYKNGTTCGYDYFNGELTRPRC